MKLRNERWVFFPRWVWELVKEKKEVRNEKGTFRRRWEHRIYRSFHRGSRRDPSRQISTLCNERRDLQSQMEYENQGDDRESVSTENNKAYKMQREREELNKRHLTWLQLLYIKKNECCGERWWQKIGQSHSVAKRCHTCELTIISFLVANINLTYFLIKSNN